MARLRVVQVGKQKRNKEVKMPQNETHPEVNEQTDSVGVVGDETGGNPQAETSDRETADLEERLTAQKLVEARANNEASVPEEPTLIGAAAKGRDNLLHQMRSHAEKAAANKVAYVPPPMTERQRERLEEEMSAGKRATERAAAQLASRPQPVRDPREPGPSTPVHRPNDVVPDPMARAVTGSGGPLKPFSPDV